MASQPQTSPARIAANRRNAARSTGPRTPEGKARSAANAISFGLFAARDFLRPEEESEYAAFAAAWRTQLAASGPAEESLAIELTRAAWRLRRCALAESGLDTVLDPMLDPATAPLQSAIDRAHSRAHNKLLRSLAELRRLQTERHFRESALGDRDDVAGLASCQDLSKAFACEASRKMRQRRLDELSTLEDVIDATLPPCSPRTPAATPRPANPFDFKSSAPLQNEANEPAANQVQVIELRPEAAPLVARGAPCPCGSGRKYKRCCGQCAPPVLSQPGLNPGSQCAGQAA